ncbi:unnamed protein product [Parnassius mnemosyne]|uniref:Reverse transcriptase domain-containing protein n=1 Tax=Parnassius mnemosyne TaxID=213953 RepID=A0AAV1KW84_9NEOP
MGKIFEQLLKSRLEFYLEKNSLLPSNQFGFRRRKSSRESIAFLHLDIFKAMENKEVIFSIFFDIVGAFNNVNLHVLAAESRSLAIPEKIVKWIFNFIHERRVFAKVNNNNNTIIGPRLSYKGVCQGGILSPHIFILYIFKLNNNLGSNVTNLLYADDLVIYASGTNVKNLVTTLNEALKKLHIYFSYLNLDISTEKSKVVIFNIIRPFNTRIIYNNTFLPIESCAKFLGVIFTNNLSWTKYVNSISDRASKAFNVLKKELIQKYY